MMLIFSRNAFLEFYGVALSRGALLAVFSLVLFCSGGIVYSDEECVLPETKKCDTTLNVMVGIGGVVECQARHVQTQGRATKLGVIGILKCGVLVNVNGDVVNTCGGLRTTKIQCVEK